MIQRCYGRPIVTEWFYKCIEVSMTRASQSGTQTVAFLPADCAYVLPINVIDHCFPCEKQEYGENYSWGTIDNNSFICTKFRNVGPALYAHNEKEYITMSHTF